MKVWACAGLVGLGLLVGCKPDAAVKKGELVGDGTKNPAAQPAGKLTGPPAPVADAGSIEGSVLFAGKAPAQPVIDTSMDPACGIGGGKVVAEQYAVEGGKLANVFVYVKSGPVKLDGSGQALAPVVLDQRGCRYAPHVIGVMQGGYVEFTNSDPTMHNIHTMPTSVGNETIDISQGPKGSPVSKQFEKPELMIPVRCNNHPWMNAFINVASTPYFAVSAADGSFALRGLPPGDYVLGAVHEKLGEKTLAVHVGAKATAKAEFGFALSK